MKNIHLLPTDKPSRLSILNSGKLNFGAEIMSSSNSKSQHIYITSDEEIKESQFLNKTDYYYVKNHYNEWYVGKFNGVSFDFINDNGNFHSNLFVCKKIILTTDQDLIANGVQAIDDDFLEWFVQNPSCEEVGVKLIDTFKKTNEVYVDEITGGNYYEIIKKYKIIIPSEESKQIKCYCGHTTYCDCGPLEEPRKETLKEAAEKLYQEGLQNDLGLSFHDGVKFGAKWQQERMKQKFMYAGTKLVSFLSKKHLTHLNKSITQIQCQGVRINNPKPVITKIY